MEVISNLISCLFEVHSKHWLFTNFNTLAKLREPKKQLWGLTVYILFMHSKTEKRVLLEL